MPFTRRPACGRGLFQHGDMGCRITERRDTGQRALACRLIAAVHQMQTDAGQVAPAGQQTIDQPALTGLDDVKIRQLLPPESFDEKGNKKRLSAKELAELKGPEKNLPGYPADRSDLNGNTLVQVTFSSKVQKQVAKAGNSGLAGIAAAKDDPETAREKRPRVSMIVITGKINENTKRN